MKRFIVSLILFALIAPFVPPARTFALTEAPIIMRFPEDGAPYPIISQALDVLRARGIHGYLLATPETHRDYVRVALSDGNIPALDVSGVKASESALKAAVDEWEAWLFDMTGWRGTREAFAGSEKAAGFLADLGYKALDASGEFTLTLNEDIYKEITTVESVLAGQNLTFAAEPPLDKLLQSPRVDLSSVEAVRDSHIVIVDPGHTALDLGASIASPNGSPSRTEFWSNLVRGHAMLDALRENGWMAVMTHEEDSIFNAIGDGPDMNMDEKYNRSDDMVMRAGLARAAGGLTARRPIFISLHADSYPGAKGYSTFYTDPLASADAEASHRLAIMMSDHLGWAWQQIGTPNESRGIIPGIDTGYERGPGAYFMTVSRPHTNAPEPFIPYLAILVEAGMASEPREAHVLWSEEANRAFGRAHFHALQEWALMEVTLQDFYCDPHYAYIPPDSLTEAQIEALAQPIIDGPPESDAVAFTVNADRGAAGWGPMREAFRSANIRPTVFLSQDFIQANPRVVREMFMDRYDLQTLVKRGLNHLEVQRELEWTQAAFDEAIGSHVPMLLWRSVEGTPEADVLRKGAEFGMIYVGWSRNGDPGGWKEGATAQSVANWVKWAWKPGAIIAFDLSSPADAEALPLLLEDAPAEALEVAPSAWEIFAWPLEGAISVPTGCGPDFS